MNISTFMSWFLDQFIAIGTNILSKLSNIEIATNVSLLDFIITIAIISMFIPILITIPNTANRISKAERKRRDKNNDN